MEANLEKWKLSFYFPVSVRVNSFYNNSSLPAAPVQFQSTPIFTLHIARWPQYVILILCDNCRLSLSTGFPRHVRAFGWMLRSYDKRAERKCKLIVVLNNDPIVVTATSIPEDSSSSLDVCQDKCVFLLTHSTQESFWRLRKILWASVAATLPLNIHKPLNSTSVLSVLCHIWPWFRNAKLTYIMHSFNRTVSNTVNYT